MLLSKQSEHILEFDKIKSALASFCYSDASRQKLLRLKIETDLDFIREKQAEVQDVLGIVQRGGRLPIQQFESIKQLLEHLRPQGASLLPEQIMRIVTQLTIVVDLLRYIETQENDRALNIKRISRRFYQPSAELREINTYLHENGAIRDNATSDLSKIRREIRYLEAQLRTKANDLAKDKYKSYLVDAMSTIRNDRNVLAVKSEFASLVGGVIHGYSGTGSTVFIEPNENVQVSSKLQGLKASEQREIDKILRLIGDCLRPSLGEIAQNEQLLVELDVIQSKATYGHKIRGILPRLQGKNQQFKLHDAYHPVLLMHHKREDVVPLTIEFGSPSDKIVLISGPNAGGKTVTIKTIALLSVMAQAAIPIPCSEKSELPIYHKLFCDIGDEQSISNDLSTFTSHLSRIKEILEQSSIDTLVVMDELGTGTDPKEGSALAKSILGELLKLQANVIATTHLGELKLYANEANGVQNASMAFDKGSLSSTYRFQMGIPGQSHAFYIASRVGLNTKVIQAAELQMDASDQAVETLLSNLNDTLERNLKLQNELDLKAARAASLEKMYEGKLKKLQEFERQTKDAAIKDAEALLQDVNKQIENAVNEVKAAKGDKERIAKARQAVVQVKDDVHQKKSSLKKKRSKELNEKLEIGDTVRHTEFKTLGEIIEINSGKYRLQMGHFTLHVNKDQIELVKKAATAQDEKDRGSVNYSDVETTVKNEVDLRGLAAEEAWEKCDEYIELARSSGWLTVTIIHGKGTGVLRDKINANLQYDKRIKSKRRGNEGEGDTGVTIVELR